MAHSSSSRLLLASSLILSSCCMPAVHAQLNMLVWPNTAFAPPSAATVSLTQVINFTSSSSGFISSSFNSIRFTGLVTSPIDDLITFSVFTDGGVRLWVDDHLTINDGGATANNRESVAFLNIPMLAGQPQPFRLEYNHWTSATPACQVFWKGNVTVKSLVPATAFTPTLTNAQVMREQLRDRLINPQVAWQTYNNPTMGSHVNMPSGLIIDATLGDTSKTKSLGDIIVFRRSNPAVTEVGGHSRNGSDYTELHITQWGSRQCDVVFQTTVINNGSDIQFLATSNGTDCAHMVLLLTPSMLRERYGAFSMGADANSIDSFLPGFPNITVHAIGATSIIFNPNITVYLALPLSANGGAVGYYSTTVSNAPVPTIVEMQSNIATADAIQAQDKTRYGDLADAYDPLSSIILWNTMFTPIEGVITPVSRGWDFGEGYVLFDWDNYFLAYMASLEEGILKDISYANLIQITLSRTLTGFVPNYESGPRASYDRTEPQIGAHVTLQIYNKWQEAWIVELLYDALSSWNDWVWRRRRGEGIYANATDGYSNLIVLGSDPTSPSSDSYTNSFEGARLESGLDNSPMYEYLNGTTVPYNNVTYHMEFYDIGMTGLYMSDTFALIQLAEIIGRFDDIPLLQARLDAVTAATNAYLWDNSTGMYSNAFFDGTLHPRYSPTSFFPLISGAATDEQAIQMMETFTSPTGFCFNSSYAPDPNSAMLVQWWDGSHDNAAVMTDAGNGEIVIAEYDFIRIEANALLLAAGAEAVKAEAAAAAQQGGGSSSSGGIASPSSLVPLNSFYSPVHDDHALTINATGPDDTYVLLRQEGWCYSQPQSANGWEPVLLSLFYSESRKDYQTCGSPGCRTDTSQGYVLVQDLCYAFNGTGPENLPCKFGGPSIARGDENFYDNNYWRGRIWGPHQMLMYWSLQKYTHLPVVKAASDELVKMGLQLVQQNWILFRQVAENMNGIIGIPEDTNNADPFYHWGALPALIKFIDVGVY